MPSTITSEEQLVAGLDEFWLGAASNGPEHDTFLSLLKRGTNFLCNADRTRMAPSRFVGYLGNTLATHSTIEGRDGGVTDAAITRVLGEKRGDRITESAYLRICASFGITPSKKERRYWVLPKPQGLAHASKLAKHFSGEVPLTKRLRLPERHEARMREIVATTVGVILEHRPQWYRACLNRPSHLRIFCGRLIVATLEENYVWLAVDESLLEKVAPQLRSWSWDDARTRPKDAKGQPYPRYTRPPSRNGFYNPAEDPAGIEWRTIEAAHHYYLRRAVQRGSAPDRRTTSDPGVPEEIATWKPRDSSDIAFDIAVRAAKKLDPEARRARLAQAARMPEARATVVVTFSRNPDVVAEVLSRAEGRCEACREPAPFRRAADGTPYLEVHHKVRLADGGEDTIDNAMALCPNCHREKHFG